MKSEYLHSKDAQGKQYGWPNLCMTVLRGICSIGIGPRGRGATATGHKQDLLRRDHRCVDIRENINM
eukprot:8760871-Heterocapsa_arctica.AAC.1